MSVLKYWDSATGTHKPVTFNVAVNWGNIGGTLSDQIDLQNALDAKVTNPGVTTDNAVVKFDGVTGDIQDTGVILDDSNNLSGIGNITLTGTVDGRDVATDGTKLDGIESGATADQTTEEIQDAAWAAVAAGTQTGITVTYQDVTNDVDFVVGGLTTSEFASANISQWTNDAGYITATLTQEQVEDYVGAMVTGNTETLITVTYQDVDGTLDFVVDDNLANYDNTTSGFITGNETITLSGDVTGSGTTAITTTIAAGAVDMSMLNTTGTPDGTLFLRDDGQWTAVAGGGDVTAAANMTNNSIVRGDGGAKGVQDTGWTIDDSDVMSGGDDGRVDLIPSAAITVSGQDNLIKADGYTITMDNASSQPRFAYDGGTLSYTASGTTGNASKFIFDAKTLRGTATLTIPASPTVVCNQTIIAETGATLSYAGTVSAAVDIAKTWSVEGTGAFGVLSGETTFRSTPTVNTGATLLQLTDYLAAAGSGSGTITTRRGLWVEDITGATNSYPLFIVGGSTSDNHGSRHDPNIQFFGSTREFGSGQGVMGIESATTVPTGNPTGNRIILYNDSGVLKAKDASTTYNLFSPIVGVTKRKLAVQTVNNSTTLVDDTHLQGYTLEADTEYVISGVLFIQNSSATPDFKAQFSFSQTLTDIYISAHEGATQSTGGQLNNANFWQATGDDGDRGTIDVNGSGTACVLINGYILVAGTTGTLKLQWAQHTAHGSNTNLLENSFLTLTPASCGSDCVISIP